MQHSAHTTKPNGPVAAAFLAAGIGSFVMGLFVVLNEISADISNFLKFDANYGLGSGVGPLSGKAILDDRLPRLVGRPRTSCSGARR